MHDAEGRVLRPGLPRLLHRPCFGYFGKTPGRNPVDNVPVLFSFITILSIFQDEVLTTINRTLCAAVCIRFKTTICLTDISDVHIV